MRLIDADKLQNEISEQIELEYGYEGIREDLENIFANLPTINPESLRPKGRWVVKETMIRSPFAKNAYCSECLDETSYAHNYCPNCGAKMEE